MVCTQSLYYLVSITVFSYVIPYSAFERHLSIELYRQHMARANSPWHYEWIIYRINLMSLSDSTSVTRGLSASCQQFHRQLPWQWSSRPVTHTHTHTRPLSYFPFRPILVKLGRDMYVVNCVLRISTCVLKRFLSCGAWHREHFCMDSVTVLSTRCRLLTRWSHRNSIIPYNNLSNKQKAYCTAHYTVT
jgi:hypothetical protein